MSLNYELGRIKDWEKVCRTEEGNISFQTEGLIWACLAIDMGAITEKSWKKFVSRIKVHEHLYGGDKLVPRKDDETLEDVVQRHIGLSTNVSTKHANTYLKKVAKIALERIPYEYRGGC